MIFSEARSKKQEVRSKINISKGFPETKATINAIEIK